MKTTLETIAELQSRNIQVGCFYLNSNEKGEYGSGFIGTIDVEDIICVPCLDGFFYCEATPYTIELRET